LTKLESLKLCLNLKLCTLKICTLKTLYLETLYLETLYLENLQGRDVDLSREREEKTTGIGERVLQSTMPHRMDVAKRI